METLNYFERKTNILIRPLPRVLRRHYSFESHRYINILVLKLCMPHWG